MVVTPEHQKLLKWATQASLITALSLLGAKLVAWGFSGSVSVLASLIDSLMDGVASLINLLAVRYALQPADDDHRFGHGKAESLAGLGQATFIAGSAAFLLLHSFDRLLHPRLLEHSNVAIGVMIFSLVATSVLVVFQRYVIRQTHSVAIKADSVHYLTDLLSNAGIILAIVLSVYGWSGFDPLFAIAIALFIFYSAWQIGFEAVQHLLDRELSEDVKNQIKTLVYSHPEIKGLHALRTRQSGPTKMIQMHVEMDGGKTLTEAHRVADRIEREIEKAFPNSDVIIHQDPYLGGKSATAEPIPEQLQP